MPQPNWKELETSLPAVLEPFCRDQLGWESCPPKLLQNFWLPLAKQLITWHEQVEGVLIQGILGGQGTGKTTLAAILTQVLTHLGLRVCRLSLDDLYKTYADRRQLEQIDPRIRWRGPPGTHDVELGLEVLQQLKQTHSAQLPRFDKSAWNGKGDRTTSETVANVDIILFEGWFVGVRPIDPALFDHAPSPIETESDRAFARDMNTRLANYLPLWNLLDRLIVLIPNDYRLSQQWRRQAEQGMIGTGRSGMSATEVDEFVEYFWRSLHPELFITPFLHNTQADWVVEISPDHYPTAIHPLL
ncbi:MAG: glycerate kinase [Timaviella obliquedivisa GSE-PSE-MK23-08B]|jgi:D-glycerate 3-kinase|nr:glycerate kinase [Timaviella obliquedivisa GSE-PSE-MK23-08B]